MTQAVRSAAQVQVQVKVKAQAEAKQTEMSTGILSSRDKKYNTRHSIKKGEKRRHLKLVDEYSMHREVRNKQSGKAAASGKGMLKKGVDLNPVRRNLKKKQIRF